MLCVFFINAYVPVTFLLMSCVVFLYLVLIIYLSIQQRFSLIFFQLVCSWTVIPN